MIGRVRARARQMPAVRGRRDDGFTLIELLVVLVILPLIIGAVAEAIIVSFESQPSSSNRLSDTMNAQLMTEYFARDVQGATEVTKDQQLFQDYGPASPQVCGPPDVSRSDRLLVGLYRPADGGASALDVAYWLHKPADSALEVVRYSCTLQDDNSSTSPVLEVLAALPPGTLAGTASPTDQYPADQIGAEASVSPDQFTGLASNGWTSTDPQATISSDIPDLSAATTISVDSVSGFTAGTLTITTGLGTATVTCSAVSSTPPSFTGCTDGNAGAVAAGSLVTQSISSVQLSVNEPTTSYDFSVLGSPRAGQP